MPKSRARGFTLIELMVVIVILGALVALVGPNVWKALVGSSRDTAKIQIENFQKAVQMYYLDKRALPTALDDLTSVDEGTGEPYMKELPNDPWGSPYEYTLVNAAKRDYSISSIGEDKQSGTDDDIYWNSVEGFRK